MYIEITPTDYIVSFRQKTDGPAGYNVHYRYSDDPDYQSAIIDFTQLKQDLVVSIHLENGVWVADHTYDDMAQAIANGVLVRLTDETNERYAIVGGYDDNHFMFVTNDMDYVYAYIVTDADTWTMTQALKGEDGVGISTIALNADYTLTITLTNGTSYTTTSIRGAQGEQGVGISSAVMNANYELTLTFSDESSYTTRSLRGPQGIPGQDGADGVGIASTVLNADYTLTITLTDGSSYTTPSIRGAQGATGATGNGISSVTLNADYSLTIVFKDGTSTTTTSIRGAQGEPGPAGPGVPTGGTTGQILAKTSDTDYDTQ